MKTSVLTKCAQSVLLKRSAASLKRQSEKLAGDQKCEPKSLKNDASPEIQERLRRWETTQLEETIHRPGADLGAGFGLEILQDEFSKTCRTDRYSAPVAARSCSQVWPLFRHCSLPSSKWAVALPGKLLGTAWKAAASARRGKIVTPDMKTPRKAGGLRGVGDGSIRAIDASDYRQPSIKRPAAWWGRQSCTCRGAGSCLCCRRFDRAIRSHQVRIATAGDC